ncbi:hypothetical protein [Actinomadura harenae]|uniref:Uncharacterized protein n=1 Tax=Actinomadura harenae TaxID=2483351 RepID=A0A3M2LV78_9ACTN|nr:hypothetical protein [Actinomadura harenae]RMI41016.1 hypothetical protein EBO15_24750 [Actinomadura harenae]
MNATITAPAYRPRYGSTPAPVSLEERIALLERQYPGVVFWWGRATWEWWALIGTAGYEAQTLDDLLVKVRVALAPAAPGRPHGTHTALFAPATPASQRTQASAAGYPPRCHALGSARRPGESSFFQPWCVDRITGGRPGRCRRLLEGVRRFLIVEGDEVW